MKQYKIDKGQIGGLITIFSSSLVVLSPLSFIGILALNYDRYIKYWIDLNTFILLSIICFILFEWFYFTFIFPSIMQFGNRQTYLHDNPMYEEVKEIKNTLERIESKLK